MVVLTLALVGSAAYLLIGGAGLFGAPEGSVHVYIQAMPVAEVGKETYLVLTVQNDTPEYLTVDEIRLSKSVLELASVASVVPGTLNHTDYPNETGYQIGFLMAPGDRRQFQIILLPFSTGDVVGDVAVIAGKYQTRTGFRMVLDMPQQAVAQAPTDSIPPTATRPLPTATSAPQEPTATPVSVPYTGVVKITAKIKYSSYLKDVWSGSGTIVSPDGLILTNAHIVTPGQGFEPDVWVISVPSDPALPPEDRFYAEPLVVDEDLDLAIMHITSDTRYKPVPPEVLHALSVIALGDSDALQLGENLTIIGYPGIGGETITLTSGNVGGFTASKAYGERSFIKTAASISGGTSGGMVMDTRGLMVGVPTQLGTGSRNDSLVDCRVIADTNGDGEVGQGDVCVPVGGFINAIRPINLALPLIEQAKAIIVADALATQTSGTGTPAATITPTP
jgi:S1-C subfamily serine protease